MANNSKRPKIATLATGSEIRRWYWLKTELAAEAKRLGLKSSGAKFEILDRICHFHDTGEKELPGSKVISIKSTFDWHSAKLTNNTKITDSYKNTQNVRRFFKANLDPKFKFNIQLMEWMKLNVGKTLGDAGRYWQAQQAAGTKTKVKAHNQFNQYTRDFLEDNPDMGMADVRRFWALKRAQSSSTGRHVYERSDLKLKS